jgi:hypothetical protein
MEMQGISEVKINIDKALALVRDGVISNKLGDYCIQMAILEDGVSDNNSINRFIAKGQIKAIESSYGKYHELTKHAHNMATRMAGLY